MVNNEWVMVNGKWVVIEHLWSFTVLDQSWNPTYGGSSKPVTPNHSRDDNDGNNLRGSEIQLRFFGTPCPLHGSEKRGTEPPVPFPLCHPTRGTNPSALDAV